VHSVILALLAAGAQAPLDVHPTHLLVRPRPGYSAAELSAVEAGAGARLARALTAIGWRVLDAPRGALDATRRALERSGAFERVDYDRRKRLAYVPNDPYWPGMWSLQRIRADVAWDTAKGSPAVVVAIVDTGLDVTHPDLAANAWVNAGEIPGNGIDDDQNGYVDDVHGYDFAYDDSDPDDQYGHGTSCAGIVAAVQDNGLGVTGVAPLCRVAGVKASTDAGYFYDSAVVPALLYCADMGFQVVSMSFYGDQVTAAERAAIDYCWSKGVLPVAAAGNDASVLPFYPGAYENVLCVAATAPDDRKSWFSNWGSWVDVAAPGEGLSTVTLGAGYTTSFAGTSGATPNVAGLAALLFAAVPGATHAQVRAAIEDTALPLPTAGQAAAPVAYGRIDCPAALDRLLGHTSGTKAARLSFVSPCAGGPGLLPAGAALTAPPPLDLYGVGLESPKQVSVLLGGTALLLASQGRNEVFAVQGTNRASDLELLVDGVSIALLRWEGGSGRAYAPSDVCPRGGGSPLAQGGFAELYRADGANFTCTRNSDGEVVVQLALRKVAAPQLGLMRLEFVRAYTDVAGTEKIAFYDWSSASYPYGTWVDVATTQVAGSSTLVSTLSLGPGPERFRDPEGTLYARLTTTGAGPQGRLTADCFRVRVH